MHAYTVEPLYVKSGQEVIAADFYRPKTEEKPAVIVMAHGLGWAAPIQTDPICTTFCTSGLCSRVI